MRKLVLTSFALASLLAVPACKEPDPNKFETHIENIRNKEKRASGFGGLEKLVKSITPDNEARMQEFAEKVIPVMAEIWDEAEEMREKSLMILRDAGHPGGCAVWQKALEMDGSAEARKNTILALEGIRKANSSECAGPVTDALKKLVADPKFDGGKQEAGRVRLEMVDTLGDLRAASAVPTLIEVMEQTKDKQPVAVHRGAATALGLIGDAAAADALLTVTFRVPDAPSTSDIGNRSKLALVGIGDAAVPRVVEMLKGNHEEVNQLAAQNGVDMLVVKQTAAGILGAMGANAAVGDLVAFMPQADCGEDGKKEETDVAQAGLRAFVAQALGFIGDEAAVEPLCSCIHATHNPGDMWEITQAIGRIGGDAATACLIDVVKTGEYDTEYLEQPEFRYEIRWEGARFAALAAKPEDMAKVREAISGQTDAKVKENIVKWEPAIKVAEECKADKACYLKVLQDASADWMAREKAAAELRRLSPDEETAIEIAKAFKVRNPDARVSMALFPSWMTDECGECVDAYESILKAEKGSMDATMQLPVLSARNTIAKLRPKGAAPAAKPAGGDAKAEGKAEEEAEAKAEPAEGE